MAPDLNWTIFPVNVIRRGQRARAASKPPHTSCRSVTGDGGVDGCGPVVDAASEGLRVFEALLPEPHGDVEGARAVVAEDDDGLVGVELLVGAGGDVAHGHEGGAGDGGGLSLPGLADVEQKRRIGVFEALGEGVDGDFRGEHENRITNQGT
jgi:hypothetical protein